MNGHSLTGAREQRVVQAQAGFTLVEIAIVLVIIGLLLGGILKGQEMINQARIKNVINDLNGVAAAMHSYRDRYRALPGDDANASTRWTGALNGNGNGQFTGAYNVVPAAAPAAATAETNLFWWHLRLAGFVPGSTATDAAASIAPGNNAAGGLLGVASGTGAATLGFSQNILCSSNLPDKIAIAVDAQLDDGANRTGQVRALLQGELNPPLREFAAADVYLENGTNQYLVCKSL